ncbi:MAG: ATP synthase F0 subunit B, partial [Pirellulaceae bacterium]
MTARLFWLLALATWLLVAGCALAQDAGQSKAPTPSGADEKAQESHDKDEAKTNAGEPGEKDEKGHTAEHHDPYDLSHANATPALTDPSVFKADAAIFTFFIFLILLAILIKFAWKPIAHGLEAREKGIADKIEQARLAAEQATAQLAQYEAKLAAATVEAQQLVAKARQDADAAGQRLIAEAQAAASKERERAVADIGVAKNQALREIAEKSVDTAIGLARNIIR